MSRPKSPCPSAACYRRHLRNGETPSAACREAWNAAQRARRAAAPARKPKRPSGFYQRWADTIAAEHDEGWQ